MSSLHKHLRNTFLAGIFAAIPLAVTAFIIWYVESNTRRLFGLSIPFLGIPLALLGIYLLGLIVTSLVGQYVIRHIDRSLLRIPGLRELYGAWKQISLTPGGKEGTYAKVVLIRVETGRLTTLGFTSGDAVPNDPETLCVFVPGVPNPINGRLFFVPRRDCQFLDISPEEAFKIILSTGNYISPRVGQALGQQAS